MPDHTFAAAGCSPPGGMAGIESRNWTSHKALGWSFYIFHFLLCTTQYYCFEVKQISQVTTETKQKDNNPESSNWSYDLIKMLYKMLVLSEYTSFISNIIYFVNSHFPEQHLKGSRLQHCASLFYKRQWSHFQLAEYSFKISLHLINYSDCKCFLSLFPFCHYSQPTKQNWKHICQPGVQNSRTRSTAGITGQMQQSKSGGNFDYHMKD